MQGSYRYSDRIPRRAEHLYEELDALQPLRQAARRELLAECRKHAAAQWLQSVPFLGRYARRFFT